ncbi:hypothetical protein GN956_G19306 [Arapaima gigas]
MISGLFILTSSSQVKKKWLMGTSEPPPRCGFLHPQAEVQPGGMENIRQQESAMPFTFPSEPAASCTPEDLFPEKDVEQTVSSSPTPVFPHPLPGWPHCHEYRTGADNVSSVKRTSRKESREAHSSLEELFSICCP